MREEESPRSPARLARPRLLAAAYPQDMKIKFALPCVSVHALEAVNINLMKYACGIPKEENIVDASFRQADFR